jgi:hypothetical protein
MLFWASTSLFTLPKHTSSPQHRAAFNRTPRRFPRISPARAGCESVLLHQNREDLAEFLSSSVLPRTNRVYEGHWTQWRQCLKSEVDESNPYLTWKSQDEKSALVCLFMQRRHQAGHRGKAATAGTAGIRQYVACRMMSTDFLEAAVVSTARAACL